MALQFLSPIHKAVRQIGLFMTPVMEKYGVAVQEGHLLSYLKSYGPCPIGDLHRVFGLQRSTLTSMLDRLEKKELVTRSLHPDDRRSFLIGLTSGGKRLAGRLNREVVEFEEQIRTQVTAADLRGFERVLSVIAEVTQIDVRSED